MTMTPEHREIKRLRGALREMEIQARRKTIRATMIERALSDGSKVYDVVIGATNLAAVTERDARDLLYKLITAIEAHTNETVEVY